MENNKNCKKSYKCEICGSTYELIEERISCETACLKKQKEEEKRIAKEKLNAEKTARQQAVSDALDDVYALVSKYVEDYGSFTYNGKYKGLDMLNMDFFPSKLWHHFWI